MPRLLSYALRSLWARRSTTLATAGGIALLVFVLAASGMLASGMRATMTNAGSPARALVLQQNQWAEHGSRVPQAVLSQTAAAPGVKQNAEGQPLVMGETVSHLMFPGMTESGRISTIQIRGIDANVFELRPNVHVTLGRAVKSGTPEAIVGRGVVGRFLGLSLGGSFELAAGRPIQIVGVFESGGSAYESEVWVDLNTARSALGMDGFYSSITAQLSDPGQLDGFATVLTRDRQTGLAVESESGYYARLARGLADLINALGLAEAFIFSVGAACGTMIVFYGAVAQRRQEIGVLRALGFRRRSILAAFLAESVALALAGSVVGVGLALCTPLLDFNTVNFATDQEVAFHFRPALDALLTAVGVAVVVGLLGGLLPSLRAARMHPVQAMRA